MNAPFFPNQLSRSQQLARFNGAPQAPPIQQIPQGQRRVAIGGAYWPPGAETPYGGGQYGERTSPWGGQNLSMSPLTGPIGPDNVFAGPGNVVRQAVVPICCISQAEAGGLEKCVQCFPDHGRIYLSGAKSGNGPGEICGTRLLCGGIDNNKFGNTTIDIGVVYGTDGIVIPIDLGCCQRDQPISICFKAFSTLSDLPFMILCFFGTRDQSPMSCEPGLALALAAQGFPQNYQLAP